MTLSWWPCQEIVSFKFYIYICTLLFTLHSTPRHSVISKNLSNIICMLMTPSCTYLLLLQIRLYLFNHLPTTFKLKYSSGWTWTNCSTTDQKLNFFLLAQNNKMSKMFWSYKFISARNLGFIFDSMYVTIGHPCYRSYSKSCDISSRYVCSYQPLMP